MTLQVSAKSSEQKPRENFSLNTTTLDGIRAFNMSIIPHKVFRGFNGIRTRGFCVRAAVLYQLSYEDPYTRRRLIYWVHQPVKGMKHRMKWCGPREYKWNECVTIAVESQFKQLRSSPKKKVFQGFNGIRTRGLCIRAEVL